MFESYEKRLQKVQDTLNNQGVCISQRLLKKYKDVKLVKGYDNLSKMNFDTSVFEAYNKERVYPKYDYKGTETGRWTTKEPNIQGMPKDMRFIIKPNKNGETLVSFDYRQAELVLFLTLINNHASQKALYEYVKGADLFEYIRKEFLSDESRDDVKKKIYAYLYGYTDPYSIREVLFRLGLHPKKGLKIPNTLQFFNFYNTDIPNKVIGSKNHLNFYLQGSVANIVNEAIIRIVDCKNIYPYIVIHDCVVYSIKYDSDLVKFIEIIFNGVCSCLKVKVKEEGI